MQTAGKSCHSSSWASEDVPFSPPAVSPFSVFSCLIHASREFQEFSSCKEKGPGSTWPLAYYAMLGTNSVKQWQTCSCSETVELFWVFLIREWSNTLKKTLLCCAEWAVSCVRPQYSTFMRLITNNICLLWKTGTEYLIILILWVILTGILITPLGARQQIRFKSTKKHTECTPRSCNFRLCLSLTH